MPITKSARKELNKTKKRTAKNVAEKKKVKDLIKKIVKSVEAGKIDEVKEIMRQFQKAVDKAVKSGWLKKNTGNRKKSRLAARVKKAKKQ